MKTVWLAWDAWGDLVGIYATEAALNSHHEELDVSVQERQVNEGKDPAPLGEPEVAAGGRA